MALLRFASFEDQNLLEIVPTGAAANISTATPRTGSRHLRIPNSMTNGWDHGWLMWINSGEFFFQFATKLSAASSNNNLHSMFIMYDSAGTAMFTGLWVVATQGYRFYTGTSTELIGSTVTGVTTGWRVFEGYVKISTDIGVGRFVLRIDGVTEIDFTGVTQLGAKTQVASMKHAGHYGFESQYFDDIIVNDTTGSSFNSWPMGVKIHKVALPTQNGNYHAWTPSAGDNFQCIDEVPPSMTDFLTGSVGDKDSYAFGDAPGGLTGIAGVVVRYYGQGDGNIKRLCRYNSTDYLSTEFPLPGTYNFVDHLMDVGPAGAWDTAIFNACEFGMEQQ